LCATDSGIISTKIKIVCTQHMDDRKKKQCTRGIFTIEMYDTPKSYSAPGNGPKVRKTNTSHRGKKV
jgi:hypothetical protein